MDVGYYLVKSLRQELMRGERTTFAMTKTYKAIDPSNVISSSITCTTEKREEPGA